MAQRRYATRGINFVTMSTLRDLLDNQKREFTSLLETTNRRIDTLARKVQAVRGSLQYSHREIGGVKSLSQELEQRINGIESQITRLRSDINVDLTRDDHSDNQSLSSFSVQSYNPSYTSYQEDYQSDYQDDIDNQSDNQSDYQSDNQSDNQSGYQSDNQSDQSRDDSDVEEESDIWQLPVKGQDGSTIFIRIHKDATVDEVISQVSKRKSIPMERLHVLYTTEQLQYGQNKHLSDYGIQDMFTLHYVLRSTGESSSDGQTGSRPQEEQMEDEETAHDSGTDEGSNMWQLSAKLNDRITHCIKIHKDAPVDKLIRMISERNRIPIESQSIVYTTKRLEYGQGKHLSDYGITDKSTMFVVLFVRGASSGDHNSSTPQGEQEKEDDKATGASDTEEGRNHWQLSVKDNTGRIYHIRIHKDATLDRLMDKISETNGAPLECMRFIFERKRLEYGKGKRLSDYGIQDKSTIEVVIWGLHRPQREQQNVNAAGSSEVDSDIWQLSVLQLSGRRDYITIHKDATVDELMEKISEKTGIPTVQIRHVMHKGQRLYQGRHLSDYSVQNKSALFLTLRLGASPHPSPT